MKKDIRWFAAVAIAGLLAGRATVYAADPPPTTITVPGMCCAGCAKKIAKKLVQVVGVEKAEPDLATKSVKVTPRPRMVLSPKALWEAVETADEQPTKLQGPAGTFTAKPKS
jgi:copper chaperone CopZ